MVLLLRLAQVIIGAGWSKLANFFLLFIAILLLFTSPVARHELCTCPEAAVTINATEGFVPQMMEEFYLADNKFLAGNSISIADLLYSCELDEMRLLDSVHQVRPPTLLYTTGLCMCQAAVHNSVQNCNLCKWLFLFFAPPMFGQSTAHTTGILTVIAYQT